MRCMLAIGGALVIVELLVASDKPEFARLEVYLKKNAVFEPSLPVEPLSKGLINTINNKRDPKTKAGYIVFSINKHANKILSADQAKLWSSNIAKFADSRKKWHDERNVLRIKFHQAMWAYAIASDANAATRREELTHWLDLWVDWIEQEHMIQYRFEVLAWEILTDDQRQKLQAGEWDKWINKNVGHARKYNIDKTVTKALGQPENQVAFDAANKDWKLKYQDVFQRFWDLEERERRLALYTELSNESIMESHGKEYGKCWREMFMTNADALRALVQAGYRTSHPRNQQRATHAAQSLANKIPSKYTAARDLLKVMESNR